VTTVEKIPRPKHLPIPVFISYYTDLFSQQISTSSPSQQIAQKEKLDFDN
jgi:hypothetical protein